ncbi:MAG: LTA synthase family protein [Firmicutes bacterium]|nr:LTA synthase family protein [Bacillota bacterium]
MERFDKFEKLDRKVEETIHEVETMDKRKFYKNIFVYSAVGALIINLILETLGRFSTTDLLGGVRFMFTHPTIFLYNSMIIFATLVVASIFRRRVFVFTIITIFWLVIGISNGVILTQRMTPFTVKDLAIIEDGLTIVTTYLTTFHLVLAGIGIIIALGLLVLLFIKGPQKKDKKKRQRNLIGVILAVAMTFGSTSFMVKTGLVETFFGNLAYAYRDYGVVYCFINTWMNTGISKPAGYNEEMMLDIFDKKELGSDNAMLLNKTDEDKLYPNILFLQLESFLDPLTIECIELSQDPCPNFRRLMRQYSSGDLTVPACGAGTANVEFEVLTGLSVKFFGPGEYPYKSVLTENTLENMAYDLKSMGYSAHAIHNHRGVFYNRNTVFANMGFDTFTSIEYMANLVKTPKNWAKDGILTECITDALKSTESRDLIYTISVQGHGKYPGEQVLEEPIIKVTKAPSEELKWKYEYYVNQIYEMDIFIGELTEELSKMDEPVILAMYGDHIPAIDLTEDDLESGNLYGTQYLVWDNIGLEKEDENLYTYQLGAHVMDMVDMQVGTIFTYQQNHRNSETYLSDLKALGYDMLYGKYHIYGGENPFEPSDMKMGVNDIVIEEVVEIAGRYYIKGVNFTPYSKISLNGKTLDTIYLGENVIGLLEDVDPEEAPNMKVSQIDYKSKEILSTTE